MKSSSQTITKEKKEPVVSMRKFFESIDLQSDQELYAQVPSNPRYHKINEGVQEFVLEVALSGELKRISEERDKKNQYRFLMNDSTYAAAKKARGFEVISRIIQLSTSGSLSLVGESLEIMSSEVLAKITPERFTAIMKYVQYIKKLAEEEAAEKKEEQMATETV